MSAYCSNIDPQKFYSVSEVAEMLGCTTECVRQKIKRKELLAARLGRGPWRISGESLIGLYAPLSAIAPVIKVATKKKLPNGRKRSWSDARDQGIEELKEREHVCSGVTAFPQSKTP